MTAPRLDNLKKSAKRWLKALRANDPDARARMAHAYPQAPPSPTLRDVQHALAREHGFENWIALTDAETRGDEGDARLFPTGGRTHEERVETFLEYAVWDHRVHGKGEHRMYDRGAQRLLEQHPDVGSDSFYTAVVSGDLTYVERTLAARPDAAREPGGSRGWTPILYACYTRFTFPRTVANGLAIARALLDRGANPNDYYMAGDSHYTALVGAAGEGEQSSPRQPYAEDLFQLLLERGAEPFDMQVLYNTHFSGDMLWWLDRVYAHSMRTGREAAWADPDWQMLGMGGYGSGASFMLYVANNHNDVKLAEWVLSHGGSPNLPAVRHPKYNPTTTPYQDALLRGHVELAELLVRYGAQQSEPVLSDREQFLAACLAMDRAKVAAMIEQHPEYLTSPDALFAAANEDRADVVAMLLDLGVPLEIEGGDGQRALHHAAGHDALRVVRLLVDRGAEIDPRERNYHATPIGFAAYGDRRETMDFLSRITRNVWTLTFRGYVDRLRDLLAAERELAKATASNGTTPLWWLPDDESTALEIADVLIAAGADPAKKSDNGGTAADWAMKRGMREVVKRLGVETVSPTPPPRKSRVPSHDRLAKFEALAREVLFGFETGQAMALKRLSEHYGREITWDELRAAVRQRLDAIADTERPEGYVALPHTRLLVAREAGFRNWSDLTERCQLEDADGPSDGD